MSKRINIFFLCFAAFYLISSIAVGVVIAATGIQLPYWMNILLSQSILLLPAVIYVLVMRIDVFKALPFRKIKVGDAFLSILLGYLLVPLVLFINNISMLFSTNYLEASSNELITYPFLVQIFLMAVIPALVEEFIFRGLFYHSYRKSGILGAALTSALVFGLIHFNLNQFCYAFVLGIVFALMVEATGSIFSSMLAHFAINTYSIIMMKIYTIMMDLAGISQMTPEVNDAASSMQNSSEMAVITQASYIFAMVVIAIFAVGFFILAMLVLRTLAKRNGRLEYLKLNLKKGAKSQNNEKFITIPYVLTAVFIFLYMIFNEVLMRVMM